MNNYYLGRTICGLAFSFILHVIHAQQRFNLQQCIQYAVKNNISVKQNLIQEQLASLQYRQSKLSKYPSANFSNNDGYRFGKSQNPSTGILENLNFFSVGLNFQSSVEIFSWYAKRNTILANQWELQAAKAGTEKIKNDVTLLVVNAYLQILLAREQQNIAAVQVQQSNAQLNIVQKQVKVGAMPELNSLELEAQAARDSANYIAAKGNTEQAKLILKSYMNIDAGEPFDIEEQTAESIVIENIADLHPENIYASALTNIPQQKINEYKIKAAAANALAAKGAMYPVISGYGSLGTNYGYYKVPVFQQVFSGYQSSGMVVSNGSGGYIDVQQPVYTNGIKSGDFKSPPIATQFNTNFGQSIGINISVPLFNGWSAKANYEKAKLNISAAELQKILDNKTMKQDIYQAYNSAVVAMGKFNSSTKSVEAAQRSFNLATKRYNIGMLTTLELITDQNNLFKAKLERVLNHFDYVFKMIVLGFYKGDAIMFDR
jgi:outer membrane protein